MPPNDRRRYVYPGTSILINNPGFRDQTALDRFERAGHPVDFRKLDRDRWHEASRQAHEASYGARWQNASLGH